MVIFTHILVLDSPKIFSIGDLRFKLRMKIS